MTNKTIKTEIKKRFKDILSGLSNQGEITLHKPLHKGRIVKKYEAYTMAYQVLVSNLEGYVATLTLVVEPSFDFTPVIMSSSRQSEIWVGYESLVSDSEKILTLFKEVIGKWRNGRTREVLFQQEFLEPFRLKHQKRVHRAVKSSAELDMYEGIDYIITFEIDDSPGQAREVVFNLKSSKYFANIHTKKFPEVGAFLFRERHLKDMEKLENRFIEFILSAPYKTVTI